MRRLFLLLIAAALAQGEILDRIAVTVGKQVITDSDITLELRISALLDHKPAEFSGPEKRAAAARLVDQLLILEEATASRMPPVSPQEIKLPYATAEEYQAALVTYHLTEAEVSRHLLSDLRTLLFPDFRFRPDIQVSEEDVKALHEKLDPTGDLDATRDKLEGLLTDQRVTLALDQWLAAARTGASIVYREAVFK